MIVAHDDNLRILYILGVAPCNLLHYVHMDGRLLSMWAYLCCDPHQIDLCWGKLIMTGTADHGPMHLSIGPWVCRVHMCQKVSIPCLTACEEHTGISSEYICI